MRPRAVWWRGLAVAALGVAVTVAGIAFSLVPRRDGYGAVGWKVIGTARGGSEILLQLTTDSTCVVGPKVAVVQATDAVVRLGVRAKDPFCPSLAAATTRGAIRLGRPLRGQTITGDHYAGLGFTGGGDTTLPFPPDTTGLSLSDAQRLLAPWHFKAVTVHGPAGKGTYIARQTPTPRMQTTKELDFGRSPLNREIVLQTSRANP